MGWLVNTDITSLVVHSVAIDGQQAVIQLCSVSVRVDLTNTLQQLILIWAVVKYTRAGGQRRGRLVFRTDAGSIHVPQLSINLPHRRGMLVTRGSRRNAALSF